MKQRVCRACASVMKKQSSAEGARFFCARCEAFTEFDEAEMEPYCPDCGEKISQVFTCCAAGYFCGKCEAQKTASKIVWKR